MTEHHPGKPATRHRRGYLPAAGRDGLLPFYDVFTAALGVATVHRALIDQAGLAAGERVLDVGCGTGNLTIRGKRAHPGVDIVGADPDPLALARARRKARDLDGITFEHGYAQRLPYPDASFDRVLSALMLHHLDRDTKMAAAAEVRRVLRPGGSLHLVDMVGSAHGIHGLLARRVVKSGHLAEDQDGGIPGLLDAAGLDCTVVAAHRHPVMGRIVYYRAVRPA